MLKLIPPLLSPELIRYLAEMGHGDEIVIGDGNFPAASMAQRLVRLDGHGVPAVLDAILAVLPLDDFVECPVTLMKAADNDVERPPIWEEIINVVETSGGGSVEAIDRYEFYERAKKAYCVVATGEQALYACAILKKGVLRKFDQDRQDRAVYESEAWK